MLSLPLPAMAWGYVVAVAAMAAAGFVTGSAPLILLAAVLTLPLSVVAVPAYYMVYGLLAQLPGANPSQATGSGSCGPDGTCQQISAGDPAVWFTTATELVGILALTAASVLNVVLLQRQVAARRAEAEPPMRPRE